MEEDFDFTMARPFEYAHKGDTYTGTFITLKAPTSKHLKEVSDIKQYVFRALPQQEADDTEQTDEVPELDGSAILSLLYTAKDVSLASVLVTMRLLLVKDVALVEGEQKLTAPLMDKMAPADFENMAARYIAHFIVASALKQLRTTKS